MNLEGRLIWISLVECLDHIWGICQVFRWFPTCCIRSIVKPFPFDKVQKPRPLVMMVNPAVKDPMDFPLIGVVQLDRGWGVYGSVGDLTRASGLQQRHMEDGVNSGQQGTDQVRMCGMTPL